MARKNATESVKVPYIMAYGAIGKTLDKIIQAATPDRFTQDFLATKLGIKGGSVKAVIPFLKRTGFLNGDGTPTDLYNKFRNDSLRTVAAAAAIRQGFYVLYEMNEYAHNLTDAELKSLIVQATGMATDSSTVKAVTGSFKELKKFADFDISPNKDDEESLDVHTEEARKSMSVQPPANRHPLDLKLGYTINLNLPATTDIAVYNAIFKSLKEHLLNQ